jgi:hypothetical protein
MRCRKPAFVTSDNEASLCSVNPASFSMTLKENKIFFECQGSIKNELTVLYVFGSSF